MDSYRDLKVWQLGIEIALAIYRHTEKFPKHELYGLTSQLRRAATSIPSNIAEGHCRGATKDLLRYLSIARGSVAEVETQLLIAHKLGYLEQSPFVNLREMLDEEGRMLAGLRRFLKRKLAR